VTAVAEAAATTVGAESRALGIGLAVARAQADDAAALRHRLAAAEADIACAED